MIRNLSLILFLLFFPIHVWGAVLYLEPSQGEFNQGDTLTMKVKVNIEKDECINAVDAHLHFSSDVLEFVDFGRGDSILTFWVKSPEIDKASGKISFAGGIPGGLCGISPKGSGKNNLLGKIIYRAKESGKNPISASVEFLDASRVLLNDGLGTVAHLKTNKAVFNILPKSLGIAHYRDEWGKELEKDKTPPEAFKIEISREPLTFGGKYFITFFTTDKQTGVNYYEVKEGKRNWGKSDSPYLLEDQSMNSIIKVKAIDNAGNERIAEYIPANKLSLLWLSIIVAGIAAIWRVLTKIKNQIFRTKKV